MILKTKYWIAILAVFLVVCTGLCLLTFRGEAATRAEIVSDGKVIRTVDLAVDQEFTVETTTL